MVNCNFLTDKLCQVEDLAGQREREGGEENTAKARRRRRERRKQGKNQEDTQLSSPEKGIGLRKSPTSGS